MYRDISPTVIKRCLRKKNSYRFDDFPSELNVFFPMFLWFSNMLGIKKHIGTWKNINKIIGKFFLIYFFLFLCSYFVHRWFLGQPRLMTPRDPHLHLAQTSVRLSPTQSPLLLQSSLERRGGLWWSFPPCMLYMLTFTINSCGLYIPTPIKGEGEGDKTKLETLG